MSRANPTRLSSLKGKEKDASKTPLRPKTQRSLEDRELNQARSKPNTVNRPVRTVRIFVHHYNSTQYCNTETVFIYIPLPPDQHVSHISPRGSHHTMCGSILPCVGRISVQMWSYLTTGEPHLTMWVTPYRVWVVSYHVWVISYHAWVVYQYRSGRISLQVSHISPRGSHHTVCGCILPCVGCISVQAWSYLTTDYTTYRVWVISYHVWVVLAQSTQCYNEPSDVWLEQWCISLLVFIQQLWQAIPKVERYVGNLSTTVLLTHQHITYCHMTKYNRSSDSDLQFPWE